MSGEVLPRALAPPPGRAAVKIVLVTLLMAAPVAGAWFLLAPLPRWEVGATGIFNVGGDSEVFIAADAWFAMCGAAAGAICAVLAFVIGRSASPAILIALTAGGVAGALIAWRVGVYLGPAPIDVQAKALSPGDQFDGPLEISALGVLLAWPLVSVAVYFSLVAGLLAPDHRGHGYLNARPEMAEFGPAVDPSIPSARRSAPSRTAGRRRRPRARRRLPGLRG